MRNQYGNSKRRAGTDEVESLRELASSFARFEIESDEPGEAPCNYILSLLTTEQALRVGTEVVDVEKPLHTVVFANFTDDKDTFCQNVTRRLWAAGAEAICFLSDAWLAVRDVDAGLTGPLPSQDPNRKQAWLAVYLSRTETTDSMMLEYEDGKVVNEMNWGDPDASTICGPHLEMLKASLLECLVSEELTKVGGSGSALNVH